MNNTIKVKTEIFTEEDLKVIAGKNKNLADSLRFYNEGNYFNIKKMYDEGQLKAYAVLFLGHNGLDSHEASLEELDFLEADFNQLSFFVESIKKAQYPVEIDNIVFTAGKFDEFIEACLMDHGFTMATKKR